MTTKDLIEKCVENTINALGVNIIPLSKETDEILSKTYNEIPENERNDINGFFSLKVYEKLSDIYNDNFNYENLDDKSIIEILKQKYSKHISDNTEITKQKTFGSILYNSFIVDFSKLRDLKRKEAYKFLFSMVNAELFDIDLVGLFVAIQEQDNEMIDFFNDYVENNKQFSYTGKYGKLKDVIFSKIEDKFLSLDDKTKLRLIKNFEVIRENTL